MSASFDLATLTFNQWLLFGVIIFASLLLIFVVGAFVISSSFRRSFSTYDENFNDLTQKERIIQGHRELYAIWIGRILDLRDRVFRGAAIRIGWRHLLSVFVWIVLLVCIAGFFSGIYQPDFWGFCIFGIFFVTYLYSEWAAALK